MNKKRKPKCFISLNNKEREMVEKEKKEKSTMLRIRQRQFKTTMKYHSTFTGLANIFKLVNIKQPCRKKENIYFHESATPSETLKHMHQETRMFTTPLS